MSWSRQGKGREPRREKDKEPRKGKGDVAGTCRCRQPPELPLQRSGVELRDLFFAPTRNKKRSRIPFPPWGRFYCLYLSVVVSAARSALGMGLYS